MSDTNELENIVESVEAKIESTDNINKDDAYDMTTEGDMPQEDANSSDSGESSSDDDNHAEYEEVDMTDKELYQVLSCFLEDSNGNNISENIMLLKSSIDAQIAAINAQTQVLFELGKLIERRLRRQQQ